jgi:hypothetical protein
MRWYQVIAWILLGWCAVAVLLTPLVALFIRGGKRAHVIGDRKEWARLRKERQEREAKRRTGTSG